MGALPMACFMFELQASAKLRGHLILGGMVKNADKTVQLIEKQLCDANISILSSVVSEGVESLKPLRISIIIVKIF